MHHFGWRAPAWLVLSLAFGGCAGSPSLVTHLPPTERAETSALRLEAATLRLGPHVSRADAKRLAGRAYAASRELAREYRAVGSPHFQNFLVNIGAKERGLCYQWTEDLMRQLFALHLTTVELHWGTAHAGTWREHNCVVVTAVGQPFRQGIVLDAWRNSGRLFWSRVTADHYPWREEEDTKYIERAARQPASKSEAR